MTENPTCGPPRIQGEPPMLGFDISERTISRWMRRAPRDSERGKRWLAFLRNHREVIATMDFFTAIQRLGRGKRTDRVGDRIEEGRRCGVCWSGR